MAASLQNHLTIFAALDPVRQGLVACVDAEDAACAAALAQPLPDVCGLDRSAWQWTNECGPIHLCVSTLNLSAQLRVLQQVSLLYRVHQVCELHLAAEDRRSGRDVLVITSWQCNVPRREGGQLRS